MRTQKFLGREGMWGGGGGGGEVPFFAKNRHIIGIEDWD